MARRDDQRRRHLQRLTIDPCWSATQRTLPEEHRTRAATTENHSNRSYRRLLLPKLELGKGSRLLALQAFTVLEKVPRNAGRLVRCSVALLQKAGARKNLAEEDVRGEDASE